ncbi:hypothetical protein F7725_019476, partial [Dissostichus mawsoni]
MHLLKSTRTVSRFGSVLISVMINSPLASLSLVCTCTTMFVSDIRWLPEHDTSFTVKVPAVWEYDIPKPFWAGEQNLVFPFTGWNRAQPTQQGLASIGCKENGWKGLDRAGGVLWQ